MKSRQNNYNVPITLKYTLLICILLGTNIADCANKSYRSTSPARSRNLGEEKNNNTAKFVGRSIVVENTETNNNNNANKNNIKIYSSGSGGNIATNNTSNGSKNNSGNNNNGDNDQGLTGIFDIFTGDGVNLASIIQQIGDLGCEGTCGVIFSDDPRNRDECNDSCSTTISVAAMAAEILKLYLEFA
jgi:hypothetical protein